MEEIEKQNIPSTRFSIDCFLCVLVQKAECAAISMAIQKTIISKILNGGRLNGIQQIGKNTEEQKGHTKEKSTTLQN